MVTTNSHKRARPETRTDEKSDASDLETGIDLTAKSIATTALVLGGIALMQPEFIPGMAIGAAVALLSGRMPDLAAALRPMVKSAVRAAYGAVEAIAEAAEEIQDLVAEAHAEHENPASATEEPHVTH